MIVEGVGAEEGALTLGLEDTHSPTSSWNGRSIHPVQPDQQIQTISNIVLYSVDKQSTSTSEKEFTIVPRESSLRRGEPTVILCGENVSGSVFASGSVTQDDDGNTEGRVEGKVTVCF